VAKYWVVECEGEYKGRYAVVGDTPYAVKTDLNPIVAYALRDRLNGLKESPWYEVDKHEQHRR